LEFQPLLVREQRPGARVFGEELQQHEAGIGLPGIGLTAQAFDESFGRHALEALNFAVPRRGQRALRERDRPTEDLVPIRAAVGFEREGALVVPSFLAALDVARVTQHTHAA
jgi:hypothetical protein